jgi:hypothetical protein
LAGLNRSGRSGARRDGALDVLDPGLIGVERHRGDVDPDPLDLRVVDETRPPQAIRRQKEVTPLRPGHAGERSFEGTRASGTDLDHHDEAAFLRHEIELEMPETKIRREHAKTAHDEEVGDGLFGAIAVALTEGLFSDGPCWEGGRQAR